MSNMEAPVDAGRKMILQACFLALKSYHCLYLQCQDVLKLQNVKLETVTKGLYYCNQMRENGGWGGRGENPHSYKNVSWKTIKVMFKKMRGVKLPNP